MNTPIQFNPYTDRPDPHCQTCNEFSDYPTPINTSSPCSIVQTNPVCSENGCDAMWIDSWALSNKFGIDYQCNGVGVSRWFPGWLIEFCPGETRPTDRGYPDPCNPDLFYRLEGGYVYAVWYDCNGREKRRVQLKKYLIQDCAIESIDASKIINRCKLFQNTTLVKPISDYKVQLNGVETINPKVQFLDVVLTDDCRLKVAYDDAVARKAVLPTLECIVDYDIAQDVAKVTLARVIDGETIRLVTNNTSRCEKIYSFTYTKDNIVGDGTPTNPLIARVKVKDNIEGDGTTENPLVAKIKTQGPIAGDGTTANPVRLEKCAVDTSYFTVYAKAIKFDRPLASGLEIRNTGTAVQQGNQVIIGNLTWNLNDIPFPCEGKKIMAELTVSYKSDINIISFPVHLFGDVTISNGQFLVGGTLQNLPQTQISSGTTAEYGDSRGYSHSANYLILMDGGTVTFKVRPFAIFPNGIDPNTTRPTNPLYPSGVPNDRWYESLTLQLKVLGVS